MGITRMTSRKLIASVALLAGAAGVAGLGTYGAFTSTTAAEASVASGTVKIDLGAAGLVPGDTIERAVTLSNTGNQSLGGISLTTTAKAASKLDTDATNGLQLAIDSCSEAWTESAAGTGYTYKCSGTTKPVLDFRPIMGQNLLLSSDLVSLGAGKADNLRVTVKLPATADDSFQGQNSTIVFKVDATQRTATNK